jgi:putative transposase
MAPTKDWPHAPIHRLSSHGIYLVAGATLRKAHLFITAEKLSLLENHLLRLAKKYEWQLEAWVVFVNHYHFVARGHPDAPPLDKFLNHPAFGYSSQFERPGQVEGS